MTKLDFFQEVKVELDTIRAKATQDEISRLNFTYLDADSTIDCIYGQMTGRFDSKRATEIYHKSYREVLRNSSDLCNLQPGHRFTALEIYLCLTTRQGLFDIVSYLKGEINEINFSFEKEQEKTLESIFHRDYPLYYK